MDVLFKRRSIRKYTDQSVSEKQIEQIIRAGMAAPSAGNQQPWHFIVIRDREMLDQITTFHPYAQMLKESNCAIVVCGDVSLEKHERYWVQDCSAATQNMLLMAHDLGLGSVWLGVFPVEERVQPLRKLLNLPEGVIPLAVLPVGYPAESKKPADRFDQSRVHYNGW